MMMNPGSGIPCCRAFLEVRRYLLPKRIYQRRKMKVAKRTAQAFASIVVLSLLMSGSVFAYTTRFSHLSTFAAPLADGNNEVKQNPQANENEGEHTLEFKLVAVGTPPVGKGDA